MPAVALASRSAVAAQPTVWGLQPAQLHERYWAARGMQVVRQGETAELARGAELFLLTDPRSLVIFRLRGLIDLLSWAKLDLLFVRLQNSRDHGYRELAITDDEGRLVRFERSYGGLDARLARVALTRDPETARLWQEAPNPRTGWRRVRARIRKLRHEIISHKGRAYDCFADDEVAQFVRDLVQLWTEPSATIPELKCISPGVWAASDAEVAPATRFIGPVWIGAGRSLRDTPSVLGPAALWDDPNHRPQIQSVNWNSIEPTAALSVPPVSRPENTSVYDWSKRAFDIVFAVMVLLLTLPIYPLVMLAIWLEDGRPFFFAHRRETTGGRTFGCLKFRSMRKDAEKIKADLLKENLSDGPQFHLAQDPRLTRVGRFIRRTNIDELPQFINVLMGHMSVVGPRPSPYKENQYCPGWREARLSVRPGVTGLWQVQRTRQEGLDFQEWIKFDLEYVTRAGWRMDLHIICKTFVVLLRGIIRS